MTPEDINNMPAGREMDALVAERVMGWKWFIGVANLGAGPKYRYLDEPDVWSPPRAEWDGDPEMPVRPQLEEYQCPEYSTDIAAAWEVVEKLRLQDLPIHIQCFKNPQNPYGIAGYGDLRTDPWIWAKTAPLAICKAALIAVSQQQDSECLVGGHPPGCRGHISNENEK